MMSIFTKRAIGIGVLLVTVVIVVLALSPVVLDNKGEEYVMLPEGWDAQPLKEDVYYLSKGKGMLHFIPPGNKRENWYGCLRAELANPENKTSKEWVDNADIYGQESGVNAMAIPYSLRYSQDVFAVDESAPNVTRSRSVYYKINNKLYRFSYFKSLDGMTDNDPQIIQDGCESILQTLH